MSSPVSSAGRPPAFTDEERRKLILEAAERVFNALGYGDATMEEIAQAAGMAKKTIYKHFPDKPSLFSALIESHDDVRAFNSVDAASDDPRTQIRALLRDLASFVLAPRQLSLTRLIIAEAPKVPELAERFYRECVEKTWSVFLAGLNPDHAIFRIHGGDARMMADTFLGAALGPLQFRMLILPSEREVILKELDERVEFAAELMLKGLEEGELEERAR